LTEVRDVKYRRNGRLGPVNLDPVSLVRQKAWVQFLNGGVQIVVRSTVFWIAGVSILSEVEELLGVKGGHELYRNR
jgi:hypothetical protein